MAYLLISQGGRQSEGCLQGREAEGDRSLGVKWRKSAFSEWIQGSGRVKWLVAAADCSYPNGSARAREALTTALSHFLELLCVKKL